MGFVPLDSIRKKRTATITRETKPMLTLYGKGTARLTPAAQQHINGDRKVHIFMGDDGQQVAFGSTGPNMAHSMNKSGHFSARELRKALMPDESNDVLFCPLVWDDQQQLLVGDLSQAYLRPPMERPHSGGQRKKSAMGEIEATILEEQRKAAERSPNAFATPIPATLPVAEAAVASGAPAGPVDLPAAASPVAVAGPAGPGATTPSVSGSRPWAPPPPESGPIAIPGYRDLVPNPQAWPIAPPAPSYPTQPGDVDQDELADY